MENNPDNSKSSYSVTYTEDEIDLRDFLKILWKGKLIILASSILILIFSIIYSLNLPNIYKSEALLSPVDAQSNMSGVMKNYGSLANLAGISLPSQSGDTNSIEAIYKVKSISFFKDHILPNIYMPNLMAIKSVDVEENIIKYDESIYNITTKAWVKNPKFSQTKANMPSIQESFKVFIEKHLIVTKDNDTGYVTIAVKHQSPYVAQTWTNLIVMELNNFFRLKDKEEAQEAMRYLNEQISQTSYAEIKQVIAGLIQSRIQQLTLIEATDFYVYDYIDPPVIMEDSYEPARLLICFMGAFIGSIIGIFIVFLRNSFERIRD